MVTTHTESFCQTLLWLSQEHTLELWCGVDVEQLIQCYMIRPSSGLKGTKMHMYKHVHEHDYEHTNTHEHTSRVSTLTLPSPHLFNAH